MYKIKLYKIQTFKMADSGRAEQALAEIQKMFIARHKSRSGVIPDNELIEMLIEVAQNSGAGFDGDVTNADDDNLYCFLMKTQDVRLRNVDNTKIIIADKLKRAMSFTPGETLGAITSRAVSSRNEAALRITKAMADQIIQALGEGLTYNPDYPTVNVKYEFGVPTNKAIFGGFVGSYKVPANTPGKYFGRVALVGAKNSHESETDNKFGAIENRILTLEEKLKKSIIADMIKEQLEEVLKNPKYKGNKGDKGDKGNRGRAGRPAYTAPKRD